MMDPSPFGDALVEEIARLPDVIGVRIALWTAVVFASMALARAAVAASVRLAWRVGLDPKRRLGRFAAVMRALIALVVALAILRPIYALVPVLTTLAVAFSALLLALAIPSLVQGVAAGLSLALRARFREGDQIEVAGFRGGIRALGLVRTLLRIEDGSTVWIPNAILDREAVKVERATGAAPVRVHFEIDPRDRDRALDAVRCAVTTLPFRRSGSRLRLVAATADERQWTVEMQTWATRELDLVRRSLRRTVDQAVAEGSTPK